MKFAASLRTRLGISQQDMAEFLNAERSILSRIESGERLINAAGINLLVELHQALETAASMPAHAESITEDLRKHFDLQKAIRQHKQVSLQKKLAQMRNVYAKARLLLETIRVLKTNTLNYTVKQQRWLEEQAFEASKKLRVNSMDEQAKLEIKIQLLAGEAAVYEQAAGR